MSYPLLKVSNVTKSYGDGASVVEVLRGISLDLSEGNSIAITGPSGSGKSTLLHLIGTLDRPTSGKIEISGKDPFLLPEPDLARFRNESIGFIFQEHHLLPQYTVEENVLIPAMAFRKAVGDAEKHATELLKQVGLSHRIHHRPAELSGGERQRAAVARALILHPRLVLCDEPTGSLDRTNAAAVASLLLELHRAERTVLVVVTHSQELAERFDRRLELNEGLLA